MRLDKVLVCKSILSKTRGMMFRRDFDGALVFEFKSEQFVALHMWFCFFPIDVYYLDSDKRVVEIKENFKPWSYYSPKKKAKYVVEVKKGSKSVKIGDLLEW